MLHRFTAANDGQHPSSGVTFDRSGNLYGTTSQGGGTGCGGGGCGTVYELSPSGGGWTETILYRFTGDADGEEPIAGVTLDPAGNVYGVTEFGGDGTYPDGYVYELTPSGSGWTKTVLYSFDGSTGGPEFPTGNVIFDASGNLYGTTQSGGSAGGGTAFMLTPSPEGWIETTIWNFVGAFGDGPYAGMTIDAAGNLYGTTLDDGGAGSVFKLTASGGGWTETDLYHFTGFTDGAYPFSGVVFDTSGNLYGTTSYCGEGCQGTVWEIQPEVLVHRFYRRNLAHGPPVSWTQILQRQKND